ncbi:MAG: FmdB family zinc ribbon protein [Gemmatimonadaceae bacterium]
MPTYEFRCANGHDFEEFFLKMSDAKSELPCPSCGERGLRQMSAGGGLLFKGSGFYITDYGKDGKKAQALSKPTSSKSDAGASDGGKSDSAKSEASSKPDGVKSDAPKPAPAKSDGGSSAPSSSPKSGSE